MDCLFCKIVAGEIPSDKLYEDDVCYAFKDIDPQAPLGSLSIGRQQMVEIASAVRPANIPHENRFIVSASFRLSALRLGHNNAGKFFC